MSGIDIEGALREALDVEWHNGNITEEAAERLPAHVAAVLREQLAVVWDEGYEAGAQDEISAYWGEDLGPPNPYRAAHLSDTERAGGAG